MAAFPTERTNGGGWARPASDFSLDGSSYDGLSFPGPCAMNCTNGETMGSFFPHIYYGTEGTAEPHSFHPGGIHVVMADGSVRLLSENTSIQTIGMMATRSGGEVIHN